MKEPSIIFQGYNILKLNMHQKERKEKIEENKFEIIKKGFTNKNNEDVYKIVLEINCNKKDKLFNIEIEGYFKFENFSDNTMRETFLDVNAPAILFPYCRTFISTIYCMDSKDTVILPIINFANLK